MVSEATSNTLQAVINSINKVGINDSDLSDLIDLAQVGIIDEGDREWGLSVTDYVKRCVRAYYNNVRDAYMEDYAFWDAMRIEAQNQVLDSYLLYLERDRSPKDRFYLPKRKQFLKIGLVQGYQATLDDEIDILTVSLPPGTGKTTFEKFFMTGVIGWFPKDYSLFFSHSGDITRMFYDGTLDIVTNTEYLWNDIFPSLKVTNTNAKMGQFNIDKYKPFPSMQTTSIGANNAGKVRASKYLLCDDLVSGIEQAMNKTLLSKLWSIYSVDARQRKTQDTDGKPCKEIHTATRWSVYDVIGEIQKNYEDDDRVRCIAVPDIDPETEESNFDYEYGGFTVAFFNDQAKLMDEVSYRCLYKNDPIEREGLLYPLDSLRRYLELPDREPDAILGICDTKGKGTDYLFLPCLYQYDNDYYLVDCICSDDSDYGLQYIRMANIILDHNMQQCEFESNRDGDRVAYEVSKLVSERKGRCNITTRYTMQNKETKIIVNADWVKKNVLFKDKSLYTPKEDYGVMMNFLTSYTVAGKNKHDDVPDGLASFALFVTNRIPKIATIVQSPF